MLNKLRPSDWAFLYFATIAVFALLYLTYSSEFYHSTSHLEPSLKHDQKLISQEIEKGLKQSENIGRLYQTIGGREITIESQYVPTDYLHSFTIREKSNPRLLFGTASVTSAGDKPIMSVVVTKFEYSGSKEWVNPTEILFRYDFEVDHDYYIWIHGLKSALRGKPTRSTGVFVRMLYLSIVTQTTLGFGDIVPLSNLTRLLIALQSILGLIMAGGFISSVMRVQK